MLYEFAEGFVMTSGMGSLLLQSQQKLLKYFPETTECEPPLKYCLDSHMDFSQQDRIAFIDLVGNGNGW